MLRNTCLMLLGLCVFATRADAQGVANTLTNDEKAAGFKLLFDGQTTNGWRGYKSEEMPKGWKVVDGSLARVGGGGDIVSNEQFGSFELLIDWKIAEAGNSGIIYHVQESEKSSYMTGPEYQVLDNARHPDGRNKLTSAASCYGLYAPEKDVCHPAGEWNHTRIVIKGPHVEHWLNGVKVVQYEKGSDEWNNKVAASKFKQWPQFGKPKEGHLCLQDHGDKVEFRNIKIRVLTESR
jgi:hypothetical protein